LLLPPEAAARGVIAASAGNHAQGLAYHAGRLSIPATIVMPEGTPFNKVKHTQDFGATVILHGASFSEAAAKADQLRAEKNLTMVHPFDDPDVIAGQGTLVLEMLEDFPDLEVLVVPIGGGGLISGVAVAAKAVNPAIEIIGVQASAYPAMYDLLKGEKHSPQPQTIAEGIAVKEPGQLTRRFVKALVSDIILVGEAEIEHAIADLLEIEKTVVEGAGAAPYAAVVFNKDRFRARKLGLVMSGGNIDMRLLSNVTLRELSREGRIVSLQLEIDDRPGLLARIATLVGEAGGNILEVSHNRMMIDTSAKSARLGMVVECRDGAHAAELKARLTQAGFPPLSNLHA
jgi:threonine dehydratase